MAEWREYPGDRRYRVSDEGQVMGPRGRLLHPAAQRGYLFVRIGRRNHYVHRLVLETFVGPAPLGHETGHLDGTRNNNSLRNLRWVTQDENREHQIAHGTSLTLRTHCPHGHAYTPENTIRRSKGKGRHCRQCQHLHKRRHALASGAGEKETGR